MKQFAKIMGRNWYTRLLMSILKRHFDIWNRPIFDISSNEVLFRTKFDHSVFLLLGEDVTTISTMKFL